jgi:hypothetical protein
MAAHKNHQLPALKSGNAGSWILHPTSEFDQLNFQGLFCRVFSKKQRSKHCEGLPIQPQNRCG